MPYTLLLLTKAGIVLRDPHLRRLGLDAPGASRAREAFSRFAARASPGPWAVWHEDGALRTEPRPGTRLREGMPVRFRISPLAGGSGPVPKSAPPSAYDAVRMPGVSTLLTSSDGAEIYEACSAAVVGWDAERLVCAPFDRPRVQSTAEAAVREHLPFVEAPLLVASRMPLLLVNALKGPCEVHLPGRDAFPAQARGWIERLFLALTALPGGGGDKLGA